jgi:hypothetical protein
MDAVDLEWGDWRNYGWRRRIHAAVPMGVTLQVSQVVRLSLF